MQSTSRQGGTVSNGVKRLLKSEVFLLIFLSVFFAKGTSYAQMPDKRKEVSLHYYRGVLNFEAGRYENALDEFQKAAAIDPYYKDTQRYIQSSFGQLEQYIFKGAQDKTFEGKSMDFYFLGKSYYEKGDYSRALEAFKAVLSKNPNDKFALYYAKLCRDAMPKAQERKRTAYGSLQEELSANIVDLENETTYVKEDIRSKEDMELFIETKVHRKADREELIRKKETQLKKQEQLLQEEREDYLAQAKISTRAKKIKIETEKWKNMKERLAAQQAGVPSDLAEFPVCLAKAEGYWRAMKESLRTSRWNSAGLNAIQASLFYCDAVLIYYYNTKSSYPRHENINRLLLQYVKRSDAEENVFRMRSVLNLKKMAEEEDRPISRSQAVFLAEETEKIVEWCRSILP